MNYISELNVILQKCDLSKEEREAFEDFMDGNVYSRKDAYPNCDKNLEDASVGNPLLSSVRMKIKQAGMWGKSYFSMASAVLIQMNRFLY